MNRRNFIASLLASTAVPYVNMPTGWYNPSFTPAPHQNHANFYIQRGGQLIHQLDTLDHAFEFSEPGDSIITYDLGLDVDAV